MSASKKPLVIAALNDLIQSTEASGAILPNRDGALILGDIINLAGFDRNHLARYPEVRKRLETYAEEKGLSYSRKGQIAPEEAEDFGISSLPDMVPASKLKEAERRASRLEKDVAELRAEKTALRANILQSNAVAELIAKGGRITPVDTDILKKYLS